MNVNSISAKDIASLQSMVYERGVENEQMKQERERMMMSVIDLEQQKRRELADLKASETLKAHDEERAKQTIFLTDEIEVFHTMRGTVFGIGKISSEEAEENDRRL